MAVSEDFAVHIIKSQKEKLAKMDEQTRREYAKKLMLRAKNLPMFSEDKTNDKTLANLYTLENEKKRDDDLFIQSGGSPEALTGLVSSELEETRRNYELQNQGVETSKELPAGDWKLGFGVDPVTDVRTY